jgi:hypothetical protein
MQIAKQVTSYKFTSNTVSETCNRCKTTHTSNGNDIFELQEMMQYVAVGGYGSVFGDRVKFSMHLCQNCQFELFSEFIDLSNLNQR